MPPARCTGVRPSKLVALMSRVIIPGMSEPRAIRASDDEREQTVARLHEHAVAGRLTLEEFAERMSSAYLARTGDELEP